jgi:DNA gyrase subunit A
MKLVPGPDFPTGGYIFRPRRHRAGLQNRPRLVHQVRAKAAIEQRGKDREDIVVTEIPYQVNKARLIERIAGLVQDEKNRRHRRRA